MPIQVSSSRVQALRAFGVPNALQVAAVEKRLGFQLALDRASIESRAAEFRGLLHEVTIPVPDAFFRLPAHHQKALKRVGRAIRLLDPPFRIQSNPFGAEFETLLMRTPAYASLRPYYVRFGGPYDFLRHDEHRQYHAFLPGMEGVTRAPGGGMYPATMRTMEDFQALVPKGSPWDMEQRVIFSFNRVGGLEVTPYSRAFAKWLAPAADLLEGAAALFEDDTPQVAHYLRTVAFAFRTNSFPAVDRAWVRLTKGNLEFNIGAVEQYMDGLRGWMSQMLGVIEIKDPEMEARLAPLRAAFPEFEARLPVEERFKKPISERRAPPVFVVTGVYATGDENGGEVVYAASNRPNDERVRRECGLRIVINDSVVRARADAPQTRFLAEHFLDPRQRRLVNANASTDVVFFHELAHGNGKEFLLNDPTTPALKVFGKRAKTLEELKADIVGLHDTKSAEEMGLISKERLHQSYVSYVLRCVNILRRGTEESHSQGAMVALNYFLESKAITIDRRTGNIWVDLEKMPAVIADLTNQLITMKVMGDVRGVEALYAKYGATIPEALAIVYKRMAHLPVDILPRYAFEEGL